MCFAYSEFQTFKTLAMPTLDTNRPFYVQILSGFCPFCFSTYFPIFAGPPRKVKLFKIGSMDVNRLLNLDTYVLLYHSFTVYLNDFSSSAIVKSYVTFRMKSGELMCSDYCTSVKSINLD